MKTEPIINKVSTNKEDGKRFDYTEEVRDFVGLVFHCPECNNEMHLHIADIKIEGSTNGN